MSNQKSFESDQFLAAIINSSDDAIIGKDLNGIIISWNLGAEKIYGYTSDEIVGKSITLLAPSGDENEIKNILQTIKEGGKISNYETTRKRKDGTIINVSLTVSPIKNSEGKIIGASTIARDVTGEKNKEQEINKKNEELQRMNKAMIGRELKMIELKKYIAELEKKIQNQKSR